MTQEIVKNWNNFKKQRSLRKRWHEDQRRKGKGDTKKILIKPLLLQAKKHVLSTWPFFMVMLFYHCHQIHNIIRDNIFRIIRVTFLFLCKFNYFEYWFFFSDLISGHLHNLGGEAGCHKVTSQNSDKCISVMDVSYQ